MSSRTKNEQFARARGAEYAFANCRSYGLHQAGLTKLEYFTAAAMTGVIGADVENTLEASEIAQESIEIARKTLEELEEQE